MPKPNTSKPLQDILDKVDQAVIDGETDLKTLVESFGNRAFGPVLALVGLFTLTPLGAIPGVPVAFAVIVILFAGQLLLRRDSPWMPDVLRKVKIRKTKVDKVGKFIRPCLRAIDSVLSTRLQWAATGPASAVAAFISIALAITMLPLGVVPFGVVIPGFVIWLFGLGIMARDGVIMLLAFGLSLGAVIFISHLISAIGWIA